MGKILYVERKGVYALKFVGDVRLTLGPTISSFLEKLRGLHNFRGMIIDLSETEAIDSTALGLIAKVGICCKDCFGHTLSIVSPKEDITRILTSMAMQECAVISNEVVETAESLTELPHEVASESALMDQVLDAHRTLMSLNADNEAKFRDLVKSLEKEKAGPAPIAQKAG